MSARVTVQPEAREDLLAGEAFFEKCDSGLGHEFLVEAFAAFDRIAFMPEAYGILEADVRTATVKRFGYVVYFRIANSGVDVIAVLHGARDPQEWRRRV